MIIILSILVYFLLLLGLSWLTSRKADNRDFFIARHSSPWAMVAFGMIGASISGVTFVSVPGMVLSVQMTYLQMCMGYILGYFAVAFVLLPVYYHLRLTSIYTYLQGRLGARSYTTGASFFLIGKMTGSAVKFYVVCMILQRFVLDAYHVPFAVTVSSLVLLIWLYTRRGGIRTLVWTDLFQTLCILTTLLLIILSATQALGMSLPEAVSAVAHDARSRIFVFDDWRSTQNFWKQFLSGVFIVVVMTGLDQDMMQKNLTCRTLREAQKDLCSYGFAFLPANLLLLALGVLLAILAQRWGMALPENTDELMLDFTAGGRLGPVVTVLFSIGIVALLRRLGADRIDDECVRRPVPPSRRRGIAQAHARHHRLGLHRVYPCLRASQLHQSVAGRADAGRLYLWSAAWLVCLRPFYASWCVRPLGAIRLCGLPAPLSCR